MTKTLCCCMVLLVAGIFLGPSDTHAQQNAREWLLVGDTAAAIGWLDSLQRDRAASKSDDCLLATLLTRTSTGGREHIRRRATARKYFERGLKSRDDPECMLEYSSLLEKQGKTRLAGRVAARTFSLIERRPELGAPKLRAELFYRRAVPIADWVRNFDRLVIVKDLPVSTPNCVETAYFCEAMTHPASFLDKLKRAAPVDDLVSEPRRELELLLDSALAANPAHEGAWKLALREALITGRPEEFHALARLGYDKVGTTQAIIAMLAAEVLKGRDEAAAHWFDTLMLWIEPEELAAYEGLALVADTSLRDRLSGTQRVVYGEAVWGLSDPLYLTRRNERRIEHYARIFWADVLFSDPLNSIAGRDTPQGRLLIRYGFPKYWFTVKADKSRELTKSQIAAANDIAGCFTRPKYRSRRNPDELEKCFDVVASGRQFQGSGRWSFWFFNERIPPLIFERQLGFRVARHKMFTRSSARDSTLQAKLPSSYTPNFRRITASALVTRFPRPGGGEVEVHARFVFDSTVLEQGQLELGVFLNDPTTGKMIRDIRRRQTLSAPVVHVDETISVEPGRTRIAIEAYDAARNLGNQLRVPLEMPADPDDVVRISDILLGDSAASGGEPRSRRDVRVFARSDSITTRRARLALYWETYNLAADTSNNSVRYRVRLSLLDAGGRPIGTKITRGIGRLFGLGNRAEPRLEWEVRRPAGNQYMPEVLLMDLPDDYGNYRIVIQVTDLVSGRSASTSRTIIVR